MNRYEKDQINNLPHQYRPLSAWSYFGYNILFALPLIGFIALIICACSSSNINRRSYARSFFCGVVIMLIVVGIIAGIAIAAGGMEGIMETIRNMMPNQG